jgi:hypothetical protein
LKYPFELDDFYSLTIERVVSITPLSNDLTLSVIVPYSRNPIIKNKKPKNIFYN